MKKLHVVLILTFVLVMHVAPALSAPDFWIFKFNEGKFDSNWELGRQDQCVSYNSVGNAEAIFITTPGDNPSTTKTIELKCQEEAQVRICGNFVHIPGKKCEVRYR